MKKLKKISILFISFLLLISFSLPVSAAEKKININTATAKELSEGLKKVGPKYAEAILKYRKDVGPFKTPEDIKNVKGIGDKTYEINKEIIVVKDK